ncbi:hypothetical protein BDM02DRAFT_946940 [Thelephora ganbajun]|uniref:Uncharacterized protein n=1 Tax=Thelephora ganbajun TaxID=370292 RepID=A0ACB6Z4H4_THEGA|nr:hypothetical protein BDM02DRAFT_946940 [Thelephora ganbajun]
MLCSLRVSPLLRVRWTLLSLPNILTGIRTSSPVSQCMYSILSLRSAIECHVGPVLGSSGNISPTFTITCGPLSSIPVDPSTISRPIVQPTSVPGCTPSTTLSSSSSIVHDVPSPHPLPSVPPSSVSSLSPSSVPSPSHSGTSGSSNSNTSSGNSAWGNNHASMMAFSLLAASLVTLFL